MRLIHPIYLDIPMLVSFAAAIEGGLSFGAEVSHESSQSTASGVEGTAKFGLSPLFNKLFDVSADLKAQGTVEDVKRSVETSSRSHTEASVAILLYDRLRNDGEFIVDLDNFDGARDLEPGALVEIAGTIEKNAMDAIVDTLDAASILGGFRSEKDVSSTSSAGGKRNRNTPSRGNTATSIRDALDQDRKRTPISNALLRCTSPKNITAVITLRTENLRDLTLSELHKNAVRVLGKVTRVIDQGESMSAFENYGMALLRPEMLQELLRGLSSNQEISLDFSEVQVQGPAFQVLPLMVFV